MTEEQDDFRAFEQEGWNEVASNYAEISETVTAGCAGPLLDAAGVGEGDRLLDIASGPGWTAAAAHERGATVTGVDISEAMAGEARSRFPSITFDVAAAEELPYDDGSFDAVVSAFGMPHFFDHAAVFRSARRVLTDSGRIAVSSWNPPATNPFFGIAMGAIAACGSLDVDLPPGVDMFTWADDDACAELFSSTGFGPHTRTQVDLEIVTDDGPGTMIRVLEDSTVRTRALFMAQAPDAVDAIKTRVGELLEPMRSGDTWTVPMSAFVLAADCA